METTKTTLPIPVDRAPIMQADHAAAKSSRFRRTRTGLAPGGGGADYHVRNPYEYYHLIEVARDMDRNDNIVGTMLNRLTTNVIQDGFRVDPQTGDRALDRELLDRWNAWAGSARACDHSGELTFPDMERLVLRHTYVDGDHIVLLLRDGRLQLVEGHRLRTPHQRARENTVLGVEMDRERRRQAYWLYSEDVAPARLIRSRQQFHQYPARDAAGQRMVLHVADPQRVSQTRGVSVFNPIVDPLSMSEDISFAKLVQAQVVSCWAVLRSRKEDFGTTDSAAHGEQTTQYLSDGSTRRLEGLVPGLEYTGRAGEELKGFSPNVPNPEFFLHIKLMLSIAGAHLGLPLVILLLDASETNFSGFRGAVDQARMEFRRVQGWLTRRFHRRVYQFRVRKWAEDSPSLRIRIERGDPVFNHVWSAPSWPYIQPKKDAEADGLRLDKRLISPRRLHAERGRDYEDVAREIVEDNALLVRQAIEAARRLNTAHPQARVAWRDLIGFPAPRPSTTKKNPTVGRAKSEDKGAATGSAPTAGDEGPSPRRRPRENRWKRRWRAWTPGSRMFRFTGRTNQSEQEN